MKFRDWQRTRAFRRNLSSVSSGEEGGEGYVYKGGYWIARTTDPELADRGGFHTVVSNEDCVGDLTLCERFLWNRLVKSQLGRAA